MKDDIPRKQKIQFRPSGNKSADISWIIKTVIITFTMSAVFTVLSSGVMATVNIGLAVLILAAIIFIGIIFDIIGTAVTTASEVPFHSMASRNVRYAKRAIQLIKDKDKVSNFCNDVIGDICGIVSGSASAAVVAYILKMYSRSNSFLLSLFITATVAALTVGGKAIGKSFAIRFSNSIVYLAARAISVLTFRKK